MGKFSSPALTKHDGRRLGPEDVERAGICIKALFYVEIETLARYLNALGSKYLVAGQIVDAEAKYTNVPR